MRCRGRSAGRTAGRGTAHRPHDHGAAALAGRAAPRRVRRLGHARRRRRTATSSCPATRRAASSTPSCSSSSTSLRASLEAAGFACAKAPGLRGRRLPRRGGRVRASGGRDGARRDLRPRRLPARARTTSRSSSRCAASASSRASGRPRCASATASIPSRCPTSSRCAATPRTRSPARAGSARRRPPRSSREYGTLEALLAAGRFCRRGRGASRLPAHRDPRPLGPLPPLPDREPDWRAGAAAAEALGLGRLARPPRGSRIELISHPAMAHLHPTGHHHHPERPERLARPAGGARRRAPRRARATREQIERVHDAALRRDHRVAPRGDLARRRHARRADDVRGRAARRGMRDRGGRGRRLRARPAAGPPRAAAATRWASASSTTSPSRRATRRTSWARAGRDRRLGRPPRQRHGGDLPGRRLGALRLAPPVAVLSRAAAGPATSDATTLNVPLPAGSGDAEYLARVRRARRAGGRGPSTRSSCSSRPASTPTSTTRSPRWR